MQELIFYVNAASTLGICRDSFDAKTVALPAIIRGGEVLFRMRLFSGSSPREQYPLEALQNVVSWEWNMDADYDEDTPCKLVADNSAITVGEVEEERDGTTTVYTEIQIPVSQTNTVELRDWLNSSESKSDLSAELAGYDVDGKLAFILQLKGFTVRNRIVSAGTPTEIPDSYLDEAGVRALLAAGFEVQCAESADAEDSAWISATDAPAGREGRHRASGAAGGEGRHWRYWSARAAGRKRRYRRYWSAGANRCRWCRRRARSSEYAHYRYGDNRGAGSSGCGDDYR